MSYTDDELSRVTKRIVMNLSTQESSEENFTYDAAGNITSAQNGAESATLSSYFKNNRSLRGGYFFYGQNFISLRP